MGFKHNVIIHFQKESVAAFAIYNKKEKQWDFISRKGFSFSKGMICLDDYMFKNGIKNQEVVFFELRNNTLIESKKIENNQNLLEEAKKEMSHLTIPIENDFYVAYNANIIKGKLSTENDDAVISYKVTNQKEIEKIEDAQVYMGFSQERNSFIVKVEFDTYLGKKEIRINEYRIKNKELSLKDLYRDHLNKQIYRMNELLPKSYRINQDEKCSSIYNEFDDREKRSYQRMSNSKLISVSTQEEIPIEILDYLKIDNDKKLLISNYKSKEGQSENLIIYSDASLKIMSSKENLVSYGILARAPNSDHIVLEYKEKESNIEMLNLIGNNVNITEFLGCLKALSLIKKKGYNKNVEVRCDNLITVAMLEHFFNDKDSDKNVNEIYRLFLEKKDKNYIENEKELFKTIFNKTNIESNLKNLKLKFSWVKGHKNDVYNKRVDYLASKYDSKEEKIVVFEDEEFFKNKLENKTRLKFN